MADKEQYLSESEIHPMEYDHETDHNILEVTEVSEINTNYNILEIN